MASSNKSTKGTFATIISTSIITNSSGAVIEDYVLSDGSRKRKIIPPPPVWDNAADQLIAMTLSIEPGIEAPPLPSGVSDQEFLKALRKPITIYNSDSPDLRNLKCRVREARNEIIEVMASTGKTFEEVINEHRSAMNNGTDLWLDAQNAFASFRENAPDDEIADYIEKVNQLLEDYGARKLITKKRKRGRNN